MKKVEMIPYHKYEITEKTPSQYIQGEHYSKLVGTKCPACNSVNDPLFHGSGTKCKCGLNMLLYGNSLRIWKD